MIIIYKKLLILLFLISITIKCGSTNWMLIDVSSVPSIDEADDENAILLLDNTETSIISDKNIVIKKNRAVKVYEKSGIDENSYVTVNLDPNISVEGFKARIIKPDGKSKNISDKNDR